MLNLDFTLAAILTGWTIALVAGIRKLVPQIDGKWVLVATALCSLVAASTALAPAWGQVIRYAGLSWIGAIGGVSFLDRFRSHTQAPMFPADRKNGV
jgi:hypothetical protein